MTSRQCLTVATMLTLVLFGLTHFATVAQAQSEQAQPNAQPSVAPPLPAVVELLTRRGRDGTNYIYEVPRARLEALPRWDQSSSPEPPLSERAARGAAESWLRTQSTEAGAFELSNTLLSPSTPVGLCRLQCWRYVVAFDPVVAGKRSPGGPESMAVVLLDGSIVLPRVDSSSKSAAASSPPPAPAADNGITLLTVTQRTVAPAEGVRERYTASWQRLNAQPAWNPGATADPPLSPAAARAAGEAWLLARNAPLQGYETLSLSLWRIDPLLFDLRRLASGPCGSGDCWYYRIIYTPVGGLQDLTLAPPSVWLVVLLDGTIVEPERESIVVAGTNDVYRMGPGMIAPQAIHQEQPRYTAQALREKIQGVVSVECVVNRDGSVSDIRVIKSLDTKYGLDEEAVTSVRLWRFKPGTLNGMPVRIQVVIDVRFTRD